MIFGGGFILTHKIHGPVIRGGRLVRKLHVFFHHFRPGVPPRNRIRPLAHTPYGEGRGREAVRARAGVQAGREERQAGGREERRGSRRAEGKEGGMESGGTGGIAGRIDRFRDGGIEGGGKQGERNATAGGVRDC